MGEAGMIEREGRDRGAREGRVGGAMPIEMGGERQGCLRGERWGKRADREERVTWI